MKNFFIIITICTCSIITNAQQSLDSLLKKYNSQEVPYISVEELRMYQLNDKVVILDAREYEEYKVSHLQNAIFVGYNDFDISRLETISKNSTIVVYCSIGIRSENIAAKIKKSGFKNIQNLYGGIFEWKNTGFPIYDSEGIKTEKVHAYSKSWSKWLINAEKIY